MLCIRHWGTSVRYSMSNAGTRHREKSRVIRRLRTTRCKGKVRVALPCASSASWLLTCSLRRKRYAAAVSAQFSQAPGMLAPGFCPSRSASKTARRFRRGSPKSIVSYSCAAQPIFGSFSNFGAHRTDLCVMGWDWAACFTKYEGRIGVIQLEN